ncbi:MAG: putative DNA binding domain-containing protein [Syntrophales bacterium]|jgi:predicted HTH transcriptional regulator|nr:putative DNA binding domain-containing protein [Syntrophales bacterium]MCK9528645.1 putative DNA binding domain-containing protein [Syntrophales bacterium]MDX9923086.1 putative DNA binding domain-containing protein [Syntrophales bacterium]
MKERFKQAMLERMYRMHALPENWEHMQYQDFLEKRRELIAQVISEGYSTLVTGDAEEGLAEDVLDLSRILMDGESEEVEFKSTLRTNLHTGNKDPRIELAVLKTLAGFLNTNGGTLVVGVADDGSPIGIRADSFENEDKMSQHLVNIIKSRMGVTAMTNLHARFDDHEDNRVLVVKCGKSPTPVFVKDEDRERFYIRTGPATTELAASQTQEYIKQRFR